MGCIWTVGCTHGNAMTLRIVKRSDGARTVFKLSGRIRSGDIEGLRGQMDGHTGGIVLDLEEVTLVDVEVVRFLGMCERKGVELVCCSPYIREWVLREQAADDEI
jgi:rRNA maturation protein Rpf1